ncbi:MAG: glycoside hydrolase family 99-like domain-containing protein [Planctomycetota bacterium]
MSRLLPLASLLCLAVSAGAGTVLFQDDFSGYDRGADGFPLWVADSGAWRVADGAFVGGDCACHFTACGARTGRPEWTDYTVSLRLRVLSRGDDWRDGAWIGFRYLNASNAYTLGFYDRGAYLHKVSRGKSTQDESELAIAATTIRDDRWHAVSIRVEGNAIAVSLDGERIIAVTDEGHNGVPPVESGAVVLAARRHSDSEGHTEVAFDDVRVEAIGDAPKRLAWTLADARDAAAGRTKEVRMLEFLARRRRRRYTDVPRKVLAFYYTWYGPPDEQGRALHWGKVSAEKHDIEASTHYPALGAYDSQDPEVIDRHIDLAKRHGVDVFIATWWAIGDYHDRAFVKLLDRAKARDFEATVYWETVPGEGRAKIARAVDDLVYILGQYAEHPAFLKLDGKPVVFVYGRVMNQVQMTEWPEIITLARERYGEDFLLIADGYREGDARMFDGLHVYNICAALREKPVEFIRDYARKTFPAAVKLAKDHGRVAGVTIIPGYDDRKIRDPGIHAPRHGGQTYRVLWEEAIAADPDWVVITSWNEWHEGSEIEPSREDGDQYLEITAEFAAKFKATPRSQVPVPDAPPGPPAEKAARLRELYQGKTIGVLPEFGHRVVFWLAGTGVELQELAWHDVLDPAVFNARRLPVVLNASAEHYTQTVKEEGDVDRAIVRYLREGGTLVAMTTQPFPFYYNQDGEAVVSAGKFGFPICGSGAGGRRDVPLEATSKGWEEPPAGVQLQFRIDTDRLPGLPETVPFPTQGDLRWRPASTAGLAEGDVYVPLARLVDAEDKPYGDGIAYIEHQASPPRGGRNLYVWKSMTEVLDADALFFQLFRLLVRPPEAPILEH